MVESHAAATQNLNYGIPHGPGSFTADLDCTEKNGMQELKEVPMVLAELPTTPKRENIQMTLTDDWINKTVHNGIT